MKKGPEAGGGCREEGKRLIVKKKSGLQTQCEIYTKDSEFSELNEIDGCSSRLYSRFFFISELRRTSKFPWDILHIRILHHNIKGSIPQK